MTDELRKVAEAANHDFEEWAVGYQALQNARGRFYTRIDPPTVLALLDRIAALEAERAKSEALRTRPAAEGVRTFAIGDRVTKRKGSAWTGKVVGTYSTELTPEGYAVESENEPGSVQIYPVAALVTAQADGGGK